jgi:2-aminoadipate transaminase
MDRYKLYINEESSKYLQIYNHIKDMIENNKLTKHEKLPPIRKLSELLTVNNTTVVKAYELLEKEGYIYKVVGSGSYVSDINGYKEETKIEINKDVITFDIGNPSMDMFPIDNFKKAINMALEKEGPAIFEYDDGLGYTNLRKSICKYLENLNINTNHDNIQIISGAQQGIDIICKSLIHYGDVVFVEEPTYSGALEVFKTRGAKVIGIPMLNDGIDIGLLKMKLDKIRPKLIYVMPNFQNPTGISYVTKKKEQLIKLAEEYDFYILEDDFISDFEFNSDDNKPLRSYDNSNRVIYIKSFSKILMPGLRIGFIEMPMEILNKVLWAKYSSDISTSGLIQRSLYYYMEYFDWYDYLKNVGKIYNIKFDACCYAINNKLKGKIKYNMPFGGINFFLELPRGYSSHDFKDFMLTKGVLILPGSYFFENPVDDRYFRINIASTSKDEIINGIDIISNNLDEFLQNYKYKSHFTNNKLFY